MSNYSNSNSFSLSYSVQELSCSKETFISNLYQKTIPSFISAGLPHHEARKKFISMSIKIWEEHWLQCEKRDKQRKSIEAQRLTQYNPITKINPSYKESEIINIIQTSPIVTHPNIISNSVIQHLLEQNPPSLITPVLDLSNSSSQHQVISNEYNSLIKKFSDFDNIFTNNSTENNLLHFLYHFTPGFFPVHNIFEPININFNTLVSYYSNIIKQLELDFVNITTLYHIDENISIILKNLYLNLLLSVQHIIFLENKHNSRLITHISNNEKIPPFLFSQIINQLKFLTTSFFPTFKISQQPNNKNLKQILLSIIECYNVFLNLKTHNYQSLLFLVENSSNFYQIQTPGNKLEDKELPSIPSIDTIVEQQFSFFH